MKEGIFELLFLFRARFAGAMPAICRAVGEEADVSDQGSTPATKGGRLQSPTAATAMEGTLRPVFI
jgi:hypothetical protein